MKKKTLWFQKYIPEIYMSLNLESTILLIKYLLAIAMTLQSIEFLLIRKTFNDFGIWQSFILKTDFEIFPKSIQIFIEKLLSYDKFIYLIWLRLLLGLLLINFSSSLIFGVLIVISLLISIRWRGTFNGGSDYMTLIVLISLFISSLSIHPKFQYAAIYYLCFQVASSYFLAGLVKVKNKDWRNGKALKAFLGNTIYKQNSISEVIVDSPLILRILSIITIIWELSFPLAFLSPNFAIIFLTIGFLFHLANAYLLGLNRFLFIWVATYPAVLFIANK